MPSATRPLRSTAPAVPALDVGAACWYRLRTNSELIPATVIDRWRDDYGMETILLKPRRGCLHLEIELDPERHFSASERGIRQNVEEGNAPGQWQRTKPDDEDETFAALEYRREVEHDINVKNALQRET